MQIRQDWLSEYRKLNLAMDEISYIGAFSQDMNVEQLVEKAYSLLGIEKDGKFERLIHSHLYGVVLKQLESRFC